MTGFVPCAIGFWKFAAREAWEGETLLLYQQTAVRGYLVVVCRARRRCWYLAFIRAASVRVIPFHSGRHCKHLAVGFLEVPYQPGSYRRKGYTFCFFVVFLHLSPAVFHFKYNREKYFPASCPRLS